MTDGRRWWCGSTANRSCTASIIDGTVALLFQAEGKAQKGQLKVNGKDVNWRVREERWRVVADRAGGAAAAGRLGRQEVDDRWRLEIHLREQ